MCYCQQILVYLPPQIYESLDAGISISKNPCISTSMSPWILIQLVFEGSVQSGFLSLKRASMDHNWPRTNPNIEGTELNHLGLVFCSPWHQFRLNQTSKS